MFFVQLRHLILTVQTYTQATKSNPDRPSIKYYSIAAQWNFSSKARKLCCLCHKIDTLTIFKLIPGLGSANMDATIDAVHLTAVMPGDSPIANFTPIYRTAFGAVGN